MADRPDREKGSILIETLIAAAIIAMILGAALQTIQVNAGGARRAELHRMATLVAQSRLASVGGEIPLLPGRYDGRDGELGWRVEVTPYPRAVASRAGRLMQVSVSAGPIGAPPAVTLASLRLVR